MSSVTLRDFYRLERKLDFMLRVQGLTLLEIRDLADDAAEETQIAPLIEKLKAHTALLAAAVATSQPK